MSRPGDNMAQTEPEYDEEEYDVNYPPEFLIECKNCGHPRANHFNRTGCSAEIAVNYHAGYNHHQNCHCTNFEVKDEAN